MCKLTNAQARAFKIKRACANAIATSRRESIVASNITYDTVYLGKVTVILEDDGYAFDYTKNLLEKTFNSINFDLIGAHGEGNLKYIIGSVTTDKVIIIYDKSNDIRLLKNIENAIIELKATNSNIKIAKINPKSFEEIILSYIYITDIISVHSLQGLSLLQDIHDYVLGRMSDYTLSKYIVNPSRITDDMILEDWIERLTVNTKYYCTHKPSSISKCWIDECGTCKDIDPTCKTVDINDINKYTPKSKMEYMALNSLMYTILKVIDKWLGSNYRKSACKLINENSILTEV